MAKPLVSVIESTSYLAAARKLLSETERESVVDLLAADPECGDVIRRGGGIRKVRIPLAGRGKSGGARVIYYFHSGAIPLLLITVFAKSATSDLADAQVAQLAKAVKIYAKEWSR
ncbi:MAG: type II toxin-antitoxin system RelE/ParE family toxin [Stellaceae bacterium]